MHHFINYMKLKIKMDNSEIKHSIEKMFAAYKNSTAYDFCNESFSFVCAKSGHTLPLDKAINNWNYAWDLLHEHRATKSKK